jgi:hypothetical protein
VSPRRRVSATLASGCRHLFQDQVYRPPLIETERETLSVEQAPGREDRGNDLGGSGAVEPLEVSYPPAHLPEVAEATLLRAVAFIETAGGLSDEPPIRRQQIGTDGKDATSARPLEEVTLVGIVDQEIGAGAHGALIVQASPQITPVEEAGYHGILHQSLEDCGSDVLPLALAGYPSYQVGIIVQEQRELRLRKHPLIVFNESPVAVVQEGRIDPGQGSRETEPAAKDLQLLTDVDRLIGAFSGDADPEGKIWRKDCRRLFEKRGGNRTAAVLIRVPEHRVEKQPRHVGM